MQHNNTLAIIFLVIGIAGLVIGTVRGEGKGDLEGVHTVHLIGLGGVVIAGVLYFVQSDGGEETFSF